MPRTKGSKNNPKTVTADFATQIAEKQSERKVLSAEIASITANIDTLKAGRCQGSRRSEKGRSRVRSEKAACRRHEC